MASNYSPTELIGTGTFLKENFTAGVENTICLTKVKVSASSATSENYLFMETRTYPDSPLPLYFSGSSFSGSNVYGGQTDNYTQGIWVPDIGVSEIKWTPAVDIIGADVYFKATGLISASINCSSSYPDFSSPLTYFKISEGYYATPGSAISTWERGSLTPSEINDITTITGNQNARWTYFEKFDGTTITNITDLVVGDRLIYAGFTSGVGQDFNVVTNRNSPQDDSATGPSNNNVALPWVSGATEYIITLSSADFTITEIVSFIVP